METAALPSEKEEEVSTEHHHPGGEWDVLLAKDQGGHREPTIR